MEITVGDLIRMLQDYPEDASLSFGGLVFYRLKQRGDKLVQVEFNQPVYTTKAGEVVVENPR
jgi:hypothetical protein